MAGKQDDCKDAADRDVHNRRLQHGDSIGKVTWFGWVSRKKPSGGMVGSNSQDGCSDHLPATRKFRAMFPLGQWPLHFAWPKSRYPQKMVRFTVLSSGSKGNATVVTGGSTRILVDA